MAQDPEQELEPEVVKACKAELDVVLKKYGVQLAGIETRVNGKTAQFAIAFVPAPSKIVRPNLG